MKKFSMVMVTALLIVATQSAFKAYADPPALVKTDTGDVIFQKSFSPQRRVVVMRQPVPVRGVTAEEAASDRQWEQNHPHIKLYRSHYAYLYTFSIETGGDSSKEQKSQPVKSDIIWTQRVGSFEQLLPGQHGSDAPGSTDMRILDVALDHDALIVVYRQSIMVYAAAISPASNGRRRETPWPSRAVERGVDAVGFVAKSASIEGSLADNTLQISIKHFIGADTQYVPTTSDVEQLTWSRVKPEDAVVPQE